MFNLPWFTDLAFQVPMPYCSLEHWIFTTRHIHSWVSFELWPSCLILSGALCYCPSFFPSIILDIFWPGVSKSWTWTELKMFSVMIWYMYIVKQSLQPSLLTYPSCYRYNFCVRESICLVSCKFWVYSKLLTIPTHWKRPWCWERLKAKGKGEAKDEMVR